MCLFKKHQFKRISIKDRKVYKVLIYDASNGTYKTPYEEEIVDIKKIHKAKIKNYLRYLYNIYISDVVEGGFIHAYTDLNEAKNTARYIKNNRFNVSVKLFECNVPKNTSYFIGSNQDIAVKQLLYVKRIKL